MIQKELLIEGRKVHVNVTQDVEPILELNKFLRNHVEQRGPEAMGRKIGSIPNVIVTRWLNENPSIRFLSPEWHELVWKKLHDPDWAYLRTDK